MCLNIWTFAEEEPLSSHEDEDVEVVLMSSSPGSLAGDDSRSCSLQLIVVVVVVVDSCVPGDDSLSFQMRDTTMTT